MHTFQDGCEPNQGDLIAGTTNWLTLCNCNTICSRISNNSFFCSFLDTAAHEGPSDDLNGAEQCFEGMCTRTFWPRYLVFLSQLTNVSFPHRQEGTEYLPRRHQRGRSGGRSNLEYYERKQPSVMRMRYEFESLTFSLVRQYIKIPCFEKAE
jgi:hypothetical protein